MMPVSTGFSYRCMPTPILHGFESSLILSRSSACRSSLSTLTIPVPLNFSNTELLNLELKRHERRRQLRRHGSFTKSASYGEEDDEKQNIDVDTANTQQSGLRSAEVKDKFGNILYKRGEKKQDRHVREIQLWLKKMKCSGLTGLCLEHFRDIHVGVNEEDVLSNASSIEPYPDIYSETHTYSGGKDKYGRYKGKGIIEYHNGDTISGVFSDGVRNGEVKIETSQNNLLSIIGTYCNGKLEGKVKVTFKDYSWMEGYFKRSVLHGFARYFDQDGRLTFLGNHRNGKAYGTCWKIFKGGGCVVGKVDEDGKLSGINIAYLYPDFKTGLVGTFIDGVMDFAQEVELKSSFDRDSIKVPVFTEPQGRLFKREPLSFDLISCSPHLPDPYEAKLVNVRTSTVPGANEGLFAKQPIPSNTVISFYNGVRVGPRNWDEIAKDDWLENAYKIFDPNCKDGTIDIPPRYQNLAQYSATLAHKTNHSFLPNADLVAFDHPRYGLIPCVSTIHDVQKDEEIFVHYGYDLECCPDWYEEAWAYSTYPVPDSLKNGWTNGKGNAPTYRLTPRTTALA